MRPRHIEVFNAVYICQSISGAARMLNVSQPTASKLLKHAESQLGFLLFTRVKGRLVPTNEASILFKKTSHINSKIMELKKISRNLRAGDVGRIKLCSVVALGMELLPKAVVAYQKKHPATKFEIQARHYDNLMASLYEHDKDAGLALNPPDIVGVTSLELGRGELVCIYSGNEFDSGQQRLKLTDLKGKRIISIEDSGPLGNLVSACISEDMVEEGDWLNPAIIAQTYFMARNLVACGAGIAIVDEFTARSQGVGKVSYKGFDPPMTFSVNAVHMEDRVPPKCCLDFLEFFRDKILSVSETMSCEVKPVNES